MPERANDRQRSAPSSVQVHRLGQDRKATRQSEHTLEMSSRALKRHWGRWYSTNQATALITLLGQRPTGKLRLYCLSSIAVWSPVCFFASRTQALSCLSASDPSPSASKGTGRNDLIKSHISTAERLKPRLSHIICVLNEGVRSCAAWTERATARCRIGNASS